MQLLITLAIVTALGVPILVAAVRYQLRDADVSHESAMTVAMTVGMMVGLTVGIVAGLLSTTDLWPPTAMGVVAGVVAGCAVGRQSGLMAVLEGAMAGLMGGAMGAMMGGMMPNRAAWLAGASAALMAASGGGALKLLLSGHHEGHHGSRVPLRVFGMTGLAAVLIGAVTWVAAGPLVHRLPLAPDHQHRTPTDVLVAAREFGFAPNVIEVEVGQPVRLRLVNEGGLEHDLTVPRLEYRLAASRDRRAEPPGLHIFARSGDTGTLEFIPLRTGEFNAYCSVAGHKEQGMSFVIRVVGAD